MTDYHELPEVPRCCGTCFHIALTRLGPLCVHPDRITRRADGGLVYPETAPHGLCSHWERRDDGG